MIICKKNDEPAKLSNWSIIQKNCNNAISNPWGQSNEKVFQLTDQHISSKTVC